MRGIKSVLAAVLTAALSLACAAQQQSGPTKTGEVTIGGLSSLSGAFASVGVPTSNGLKMAVAKVNQKGFVVGGTKYTFNLVDVDDRSDPAASVAGVTGLLRDNKAIAVLGPTTPVGTGSAQLTQPSSVIQLSAASAFLTMAGQSGNRALFAAGASAATRGGAIAQAIKTFIPTAKKAVLVGPNDANGAVLAPAIQTAVTQAGLTVTQQLYPSGTTDLVPVFTRVAADNPDVIVGGWSYTAGSAALTNYLQQMNPAGVSTSTAFVGYAISPGDCNNVGGRTCVSVAGGFDVSVDNPNPRVKQFISDYLAFANATALPGVAQAIPSYYDGVFILAAAMEKAGTVTNLTAISDALRKVSVDGVFYSGFRPDNSAVLVGGLRCSLIKGGQTTAQYCGK
jgi:branched-chain amino acid transport system substrate-binding protein